MKRLLKILLGLIVVIGGLYLIRLKPKTVTFGHFAGECVGNCGTMYQVGGKIIIRDTTTFFQAQNNLNKFTIKYQNVVREDDEGKYNNFKMNVPLLMLFDPRSRFGCPDCHDQGGYYFQFSMLGITRRYQIDRGYEPFYYKDLTIDIDNRIEKVTVELKQHGRLQAHWQ